jgi:hypothetical protein
MLTRYSFVVALVLCACGNNNTAADSTPQDTALSSQTIHTNVTDTIVTGAKPVNLNGCYQMTLKRDTASLQLTMQDSTVTGTLQYHWYERDANDGTLQGVLRNDTIYADYTFRSEGMTSVREVVFKIQDDTLVEGFGELTEQQGKVVFRDRSKLQFQNAYPFIKVACPQR